MFKWFDHLVLLDRQSPDSIFYYYNVRGKGKKKSKLKTMITGTEHSVALYILPRAFGVIIS